VQTVLFDLYSSVDLLGMQILLKKVESEAFCTRGYSPFLNFTVPDLHATTEDLKKYGAELDGDILDREFGKLASLKAPDGQMIGLFQPKEGSEFVTEPEIPTDFYEQEEADPTTKELKRILRNMKV